MGVNYTSRGAERADLGMAISEFGADDPAFVARQIFGVKDTPKEAAAIPVLVRENTKRPVSLKRAPGSSFARGVTRAEDLSYKCYNYGMEEKVPDEHGWLYRNEFSAEQAAAKIAKRKLMVEAEVRVAAILENTSTFTGAALFKDYSGAAWATTTNPIIDHVAFAKQKVWSNTGMEADSIVMSLPNYYNCITNDQIIARYPGISRLPESEIRSSLADVLGLENVYIGRGRYDSANSGATYTGANIWSDSYVNVFKRLDENELDSGGVGVTMRWSEADEYIDRVFTYREEATKSDIVRVEEYVDELLIDAFFGFLVQVA